MSNNRQLVNINSCNACNSWSSGNDVVGWVACNDNKNDLVPMPQYSNENGFYNSIGVLQDALNNNWANSSGSCASIPNPNFDSSVNASCQQCYSDSTAYPNPGPVVPPSLSENFQTGFFDPSKRADAYSLLNQSWKVQKPYNL